MPNNGTQFVAPTWVAANVLYGTAFLFTSPEGTALPADIDLGDSAAWATASWNYVGASDQGVTITFNPSVTQIQIEEQMMPTASPVSTAQFTVDVSLAEDTLANMQLAYGGGGSITATAAATGQPGKSVLKLSDTFPVLQAGLIGTNAQGFPRVLYVPRVMSAGQVATSFRRAADKRMYPVTLNALCDLPDIVVTDITAAAT